MLFQFPHCGVAAGHDVLQAVINLFLSPSQALNVLRPFEIARGHTPRVREDVWDDRDPTSIQNLIRFGIGGRVGSLDDRLRLDTTRDLRREHSTERRRNEDVRGRHENFFVGNV